jgi:hypothetical protein
MPAIQGIKLSILAFYLRLNPDNTFRYVVLTVMAICGSLGVSVIFADVFQCSPVSKGWYYYLEGTCINQHLFFTSTAIINIVLDFVLFLLPLQLMWGLQMRRQQKYAVCGIFSVWLMYEFPHPASSPC